MNEQRIKLAEAMGWLNIQERTYPHEFRDELVTGVYGYAGPYMSVAERLPDPFTDANDDYAVLEWMRSQAEDNPAMLEAFRDAISDMTSHEKGFAPYTWRYQIGDYARAALKVLDNGGD